MSSTDKINMSLGDIIKLNKVGQKSKGGRGKRGMRAGRIARNTNRNRGQVAFGNKTVRGTVRGMQRFRGFGSSLRNQRFGQNLGVIRGGVQRRRAARVRPSTRRQLQGAWKQDLYVNNDGIKKTAEGKLFISNLEYGVNDSDMKELFSEFGQLKKAAVHYDFSGRSMGTAEVIFNSQVEAIKALNQYNTVPLDGRPMNIQLVADIKSPNNQGLQGRINFGQKLRRRFGAQMNNGFRNFGNRPNNQNNKNKRGGGQQMQQQNQTIVVKQDMTRGQTRGRGGRGRGRGSRGGRQALPTKEELDAQLDDYIKMDLA